MTYMGFEINIGVYKPNNAKHMEKHMKAFCAGV